MLKYSGKEIKFWANFFIILHIVRSVFELMVLLAMYLSPNVKNTLIKLFCDVIPIIRNESIDTIMTILVAIVCIGIVIGYLIVRFFCTLLYAYGELADRIIDIDSKMTQELQVLKSIEKHIRKSCMIHDGR